MYNLTMGLLDPMAPLVPECLLGTLGPIVPLGIFHGRAQEVMQAVASLFLKIAEIETIVRDNISLPGLRRHR